MSDRPVQSEAERVLKEREEATLAALASLRESSAPPALDGTIGRLTHIDAHQQHQMALHGRRRLELQLETIRGALARVQAGRYGLCVMCGDAIAAERLEATPEAPFCAACQEAIDRETRA